MVDNTLDELEVASPEDDQPVMQDFSPSAVAKSQVFKSFEVMLRYRD